MSKLFAITVFLVSLPLMTSADVWIDEDAEIVEYKHVEPHGITPGPGRGEIWFSGRRTNTVGRIDRWGSVTHYELDTNPARLIYLKQGPAGGVWGTELLGNKILRADRHGNVKEYPIPTEDSRPIAITPGPDGNMWFSEEAGRKVARIDQHGNIVEFPVPLPEGGDRLLVAGLAFDDRGYLWTHVYRGRTGSEPDGDDFIVRFGREIVNIDPEDLSDIEVTLYPVPSRGTIMHRITQGPDGRIWFTELGTDKVGVLTAD